MCVYKTKMTLVGWIITLLSESEMVSSISKPPWRGFSVLISVWDRSQMRTFLEPGNGLILYLGLSLRPLPWLLRLRPLLEPWTRALLLLIRHDDLAVRWFSVDAPSTIPHCSFNPLWIWCWINILNAGASADSEQFTKNVLNNSTLSLLVMGGYDL